MDYIGEAEYYLVINIPVYLLIIMWGLFINKYASSVYPFIAGIIGIIILCYPLNQHSSLSSATLPLPLYMYVVLFNPIDGHTDYGPYLLRMLFSYFAPICIYYLIYHPSYNKKQYYKLVKY